TFSDRYYGLEALALASVVETINNRPPIESMPEIPGVASSPPEKLALARLWLKHWQRLGFWIGRMPQTWWKTRIKSHSSGKFTGMKHLLREPKARRLFEKEWIPKLLQRFTEEIGNQHRLKGA